MASCFVRDGDGAQIIIPADHSASPQTTTIHLTTKATNRVAAVACWLAHRDMNAAARGTGR